MSDLTNLEKRQLEKLLDMGEGYVLEFSNRTFEEFFLDTVQVHIYDEKYELKGNSKANRMRTFWSEESNLKVVKILESILEGWSIYSKENSVAPEGELNKIISRLKDQTLVPNLSAIQPNSDEESFEILFETIRHSIEKNQPQSGLDRLHTYCMKFFRNLCEKHQISFDKSKPLHSLAGEYVKVIKNKGLIESDITEKILKSSLGVMQEFNNVRNNHSLAHDNELLNYHESLLILNNVTSSIRFIKEVESKNN